VSPRRALMVGEQSLSSTTASETITKTLAAVAVLAAAERAEFGAAVAVLAAAGSSHASSIHAITSTEIANLLANEPNYSR